MTTQTCALASNNAPLLVICAHIRALQKNLKIFYQML
jgi:hypothetical protein